MIEVCNLKKTYGDLCVLKDVSTTINKGDVISIIGPSGTGKSTFLHCLNLLESPTGGSIRIDGKDITAKGANISYVRQKMGMVFQTFDLFNHLTVMENLTISQIKLLHKSKSEAEAKGMELLKMVGLAEKASSYPSQLSGGQQQRVAIARCLSMNPEIILFDEPTSSLDSTMISEVLGVIRTLAKRGMTMIIVTHEMKFAREMSTRILFMDQGAIYEEGTPEEIFENPQKERTRHFINSIKNFKFEIKDNQYDLYALNAEIEGFAKRYFFSRKKLYNLLLAVEEGLQILPIEKGVNLIVEFSEEENKTLVRFIQRECHESIIESADLISMSILKGISENVEEVTNVEGIELRLLLNEV